MSGVKFLIVLTLISFCVGSRKFYYPELCDFKKLINDCSFQFSQTNTCYVYEGNECSRRYDDLSEWNLKPLNKPVSEIDAEFVVSILPYDVYIYDIQRDNPLSAINITFTSLNKAINGFSLVMSQKTRDACRLIDFRKAMDNISVPFTFYYDCLHQLVERGWKMVSMVFRAYPLNTELSYLVHIPPKQNENLIASPCSWRPLVMVFKGGLPKYDVHVKFSNAPERLKIIYFNVTLVDSFGSATSNRIPSSIKSDMISTKFHVVNDGNYKLLVGIISEKESCPVSETYIYVGDEIKDYSLIVFIVLLIVMIISASLLTYFSCQCYIRNASPTSKCTVLFVYQFKRLHHEFLITYSRYLYNQYGMKVNMLYEKSGNPKIWLEEKYSQSNIIVFVISSSLKALDQGSSGEGEHHWIDQLAEAKALIDDTYIGKKKICKICFPYSKKDDVPKCLERQGPLFILPKDLDKFLCFAYECPRHLFILSKLFNQNHHKVLKPIVKLDNNEEIKEKLEIIMKTASRDSLIIQVENINENNLKRNMEKSKCDALVERENFPISENPLIKSEDKKLDIPLQETNLNEVDNDDFMLYCVRKILYSG